jgi:hypothetical protein
MLEGAAMPDRIKGRKCLYLVPRQPQVHRAIHVKDGSVGCDLWGSGFKHERTRLPRQRAAA